MILFYVILDVLCRLDRLALGYHLADRLLDQPLSCVLRCLSVVLLPQVGSILLQAPYHGLNGLSANTISSTYILMVVLFSEDVLGHLQLLLYG